MAELQIPTRWNRIVVGHRHALWIMGLNFGVSGTLVFIAIYLPLILQDQSFSLFHIGIALACGSLVGFFGQLFWGVVSDKYGTIRTVMLILLLGTAILFIGLYVSDLFVTVILFAILIRFCTTSILPFIDLWTLNYAVEQGKNFGGYRQWGSVGYVINALVMGAAAATFGLHAVYWVHWIILVICICIVVNIPETVRRRTGTPDLKEGMKLFRQRSIWLFFASVLLISIPARAFGGFYSLYVKELGGSAMMIAVAAIIAPLFEVPFYFVGFRWVNRLGVSPLLIISAVLYAIVWFFYIWNDSLLFLMLSQILLGGAHVLFYLAAMIYMRQQIPENFRSTGQLLLFMLMYTLSGVIGSLLAGYMLSYGSGAWFFAISFLSTCCAIVLFRLLHVSIRGG